MSDFRPAPAPVSLVAELARAILLAMAAIASVTVVLPALLERAWP